MKTRIYAAPAVKGLNPSSSLISLKSDAKCVSESHYKVHYHAATITTCGDGQWPLSPRIQRKGEKRARRKTRRRKKLYFTPSSIFNRGMAGWTRRGERPHVSINPEGLCRHWVLSRRPQWPLVSGRTVMCSLQRGWSGILRGSPLDPRRPSVLD